MIGLYIALLILGAFTNAIMDLSSEGLFPASWMNKNESWTNKWKHGNPEEGERFLFSSTILVCFTDLWHFAQFVFHSSWQIAISIHFDCPIYVFLFIKITFSAVFEIVYSQTKKLL